MSNRCAGLAALCAATVLLAGCTRDRSSYDACYDCNVVLISVDTLRADHVGALGYARATTPSIDALAARGVLFENAIAQSSWTRPAHMSILTGLHPREHGFVSLGDSRPLEDSIPTLASVLRSNGYTTGAFVGGVNMSASFGFDQGFDVYRSNGRSFRDNMEDARFWLDQNAGRKFFLFFHGYDAHTPYLSDPVDRLALDLNASRPEAGLAAVCRGEGPVSRVAPFIDQYDAAIHRADRYVGKMIAELETRGLLSHTIVVLLSDHGEEFLEHDRCFHISTVYREVLHVPVVLVAPGLEPRRVSSLVSASVTIAPTLMELLGIREHPFPGPSLVAAAVGGAAPAEAIVSETERSTAKRGDGHVLALTEAGDKLIHWTDPERFACFDLIGDPGERRGVAASPRQASLSRRLDAWTTAHQPRSSPRRKTTATPPGASPAGPGVPGGPPQEDDDSPDQEERLRSLGYAE